MPVVFSESSFRNRQRKHQRYSLKCPGSFCAIGAQASESQSLRVVELSDDGFLAYSKGPLPNGVWGEVNIHLGTEEKSIMKAMVMRGNHNGVSGFYGFKLDEPDLPAEMPDDLPADLPVDIEIDTLTDDSLADAFAEARHLLRPVPNARSLFYRQPQKRLSLFH